MSDYLDAADRRKAELMRSSMGVGMTKIQPTDALFTPEDVQQALVILDTAPIGDRKGAMRLVMLHALRCAAINLDVK